MGSPGCPDLDFSIASTAKKRIELIQSSSRDWVTTAIISCFLRMGEEFLIAWLFAWGTLFNDPSTYIIPFWL